MAQRRHAAHRIWARLTTEEGVEVGESTVRDYVRMLREGPFDPAARRGLAGGGLPGLAARRVLRRPCGVRRALRGVRLQGLRRRG